MKAAIVGIAGIDLRAEEAALFAAHPPAGVILFGRNIAGPDQLRALTAALRAALPPGAVIAVDQEGGRVARLRPPGWRGHPPAAALGARYDADPVAGLRATWLTGALIGLDCAQAGFDLVCAPVLDVRWPGITDAIGDRAYSEDPAAVAALGRAMANGLLAAGVQPAGKHAPGHGRASVDSHLMLPVVRVRDLDADLLPFRRNAHLPWMLTSHILYPALDPERPATLSPAIVADVIRGRIGFQGVLASDDLAMQALSGDPVSRALGCLAAGCDIALFSPGDPDANAAVLRACPDLTPDAARRMAASRDMAAAARTALDGVALAAERDTFTA